MDTPKRLLVTAVLRCVCTLMVRAIPHSALQMVQVRTMKSVQIRIPVAIFFGPIVVAQMGRGTKCASRICALVQRFARATKRVPAAQHIGYRAEAGHSNNTQIQTISVVERTSLCDYGTTSSYVFAASVRTPPRL